MFVSERPGAPAFNPTTSSLNIIWRETMKIIRVGYKPCQKMLEYSLSGGEYLAPLQICTVGTTQNQSHQNSQNRQASGAPIDSVSPRSVAVQHFPSPRTCSREFQTPSTVSELLRSSCCRGPCG